MDPSLTQLAKRLYAARVDNQEEIAKRIKASSPETYVQLFAEQLALQKLNVVLRTPEKTDLPQIIESGGKTYFIQVAATQLLPDMHQFHLKKYALIKSREMQQSGANGLVLFLPFSFNNDHSRRILSANMPVGMVDLNYNKTSLDRRVALYCR